MAVPRPIQERIDEIKKAFGDHPNCYLVATLLATAFGGTIYYDHNHCVAQIGNAFYDRRGEVSPDEIVEKGYTPLQEYGIFIERTLVQSLIENTKINLRD